jgi:hypothetical protein
MIEIAKSDEPPPLCVIPVDQEDSRRDYSGIVVRTVTDGPASIPVARLVNTVVVRAVENLIGLPEITAGQRRLDVGPV